MQQAYSSNGHIIVDDNKFNIKKMYRRIGQQSQSTEWRVLQVKIMLMNFLNNCLSAGVPIPFHYSGDLPKLEMLQSYMHK